MYDVLNCITLTRFMLLEGTSLASSSQLCNGLKYSSSLLLKVLLNNNLREILNLISLNISLPGIAVISFNKLGSLEMKLGDI